MKVNAAMIKNNNGHDFIEAETVGDLFRKIKDLFPDDEYFTFSIIGGDLYYTGSNHDGQNFIEIIAMDKDFDEGIYSYLDFYADHYRSSKPDTAKKYFDNREAYRNKHAANIIDPIAKYYGWTK